MIGYYIHWVYPASADNDNFYGGRDDNKLFHHEENAIKYAKEQLRDWEDKQKRFDELNEKDDDEGLSFEEKDEWTTLALICCGDLPYDYTVRKKEIKFEDEE